MLAVLEEVGTPAVLVGHSLGGVVAWWLAQKHPGHVIAAFLEDPPLFAAEASEAFLASYREVNADSPRPWISLRRSSAVNA